MTSDQIDKLIVLASGGDMLSLEVLYQELKDAVYALTLAITRVPAAAEDITQDTFVHVALARSFTPRGYGKAWVLKIARNLALRYLRQEKRTAPISDTQLLEEGEPSLDKLALEQALARLNELDRQIVLLHVSGLKHEEIARILGRPAATIRWRYARAVKKLCEILNDIEGGAAN